MKQLRIFSNGGGVQSTAALVLSAQGAMDFPIHAFSNVGADSENPDTVRYVEDIAMPYAAAHGIEFVVLDRQMRDGTTRTLYEEIQSETLSSIPIPSYNQDGAPGRRSCTKHYKVEVIAKYSKHRGATPKSPAVIGMGISLDEFERMRTDNPIAWHRSEYPLIDMRLSRRDCLHIIERAGLPIPPKSSCWFCPFHNTRDWIVMKQRQPELFMNAVVLELDMNAKLRRINRPPRYLSRHGKPLCEAIGDQSVMDLDESFCESGHCMT